MKLDASLLGVPLAVSCALFGLPATPAAPLHAQSISGVSAETVQLTPGSRAVALTVDGNQLGRVTSVRLLRDGRPVRDVKVEIASRSGGRLSLSLSADRRAAPGAEYRLELVAGRRTVSVPVAVRVGDIELRRGDGGARVSGRDPRERRPRVSRAGPAPDLIIPAVRLLVRPAGHHVGREGLPIDTESRLTLMVEARNQGEGPAVFPDQAVHWKLIDGLGTATPGGDFTATCGNTLQPGEQCLSQSVEIASPGDLREGSYELVVQVDPDEDVQESDELNNEHSFTFDVGRHRSIEKYWIWNPRPGEYGELEEAGIVDPDAAEPGDPSDGIFFVQGRNLDFPELRLRIGDREAQILRRSQEAGMDVIEGKLQDFEGGYLEAGDGTVWARSPAYVPRVGYRALDVGALNDMPDAIQCSVGSPVGSGTLSFLDGSTQFDVPRLEEAGFQVDIVDLRSNSATVGVEQGMDPGSEFVLKTDIQFETSGREFEGEFLPEVTWWECGTFEVPASQCSNGGMSCFLQALGDALASAPSCLVQDNWVERTGPGPAIPVAGDLTSPRVVVRTALGLAGGELAPRRTELAFTANVSLQTGQGEVPLGPLESLVLGRINAELQEAAQEAGIGERIAQHLNDQLGWLAGESTLHWLKPLPDQGRVYVEYRN